MPHENLSQGEIQRYSRHLLLPEVGIAGQGKIKSARVLVIGAGGLGSPVILYLAAAGVGTIGIADFDCVDLSNLQRQVIYGTDDVSASKVRQAAARAQSLNPNVKIIQHEVRLSVDNIIDVMAGYDLIVDGTDNFTTRYLVNDACVLTAKPNVYGSIYRFEGQASVFALGDGPCYRCLFPSPPADDSIPNCAEGGVLGVMAGVIGCIQAPEALKIIAGIGESLAGRLLIYDALSMSFDSLVIPKSPTCPVCTKVNRITQLVETAVYWQKDVMLVTAVALSRDLDSGCNLKLVDVRTSQEVALGKIQNSIHISLAELPGKMHELDKSDDIVLYCKSGARSASAARLLMQNGFTRVRSLQGGIKAWSEEVDPALDIFY